MKRSSLCCGNFASKVLNPSTMLDWKALERRRDIDEGFGLKLGLAASLFAALCKWKERAAVQWIAKASECISP